MLTGESIPVEKKSVMRWLGLPSTKRDLKFEANKVGKIRCFPDN